MKFVANNPGAGNQSAILRARDTGGEPVPIPAGSGLSPVLTFSALRDVDLVENMKSVRMA